MAEVFLVLVIAGVVELLEVLNDEHLLYVSARVDFIKERDLVTLGSLDYLMSKLVKADIFLFRFLLVL